MASSILSSTFPVNWFSASTTYKQLSASFPQVKILGLESSSQLHIKHLETITFQESCLKQELKAAQQVGVLESLCAHTETTAANLWWRMVLLKSKSASYSGQNRSRRSAPFVPRTLDVSSACPKYFSVLFHFVFATPIRSIYFLKGCHSCHT